MIVTWSFSNVLNNFNEAFRRFSSLSTYFNALRNMVSRNHIQPSICLANLILKKYKPYLKFRNISNPKGAAVIHVISFYVLSYFKNCNRFLSELPLWWSFTTRIYEMSSYAIIIDIRMKNVLICGIFLI